MYIESFFPEIRSEITSPWDIPAQILPCVCILMPNQQSRDGHIFFLF